MKRLSKKTELLPTHRLNGFVRQLALISVFVTLTGVSLFAYSISVYENNVESQFGRASERDEIITLDLEKFTNTETLEAADPSGFLTAVVVDSEVKATLDNLLSNKKQVEVGSMRLELRDYMGKKRYFFLHKDYEIEFSFSLEHPGPQIIEIIEKVYSDSAYWRERVKNHYRRNFVVRVYAAENCINPKENTLTFTEAIIAATIIGDRHQMLWGMHDGFGMFEKFAFFINSAGL